MKPCSLWTCYTKRKMAENQDVGTLSSFLNRCNDCCHNHPTSAYRAETNRRLRHAFAEWFMSARAS